MDKPSLIPSLKLIFAAFGGGMVLSLLELMNMARAHENVADPYFYLGMFIAGILGIVGLLVSRSKDLGGAVTAGISAPQILAGIAKAGAVTQTVFFSIVAPPVYAQEPVVTDTVTVTIIAETDRPISVRPETSKGGYFLTDTLQVKVPRNQTLIFSGGDVGSSSIGFDGTRDSVMVRAKVITHVQKQQKKNIWRGMFAQQMAEPDPDPARIELEIIKKAVEE